MPIDGIKDLFRKFKRIATISPDLLPEDGLQIAKNESKKFNFILEENQGEQNTA